MLRKITPVYNTLQIFEQKDEIYVIIIVVSKRGVFKWLNKNTELAPDMIFTA